MDSLVTQPNPAAFIAVPPVPVSTIRIDTDIVIPPGGNHVMDPPFDFRNQSAQTITNMIVILATQNSAEPPNGIQYYSEWSPNGVAPWYVSNGPLQFNTGFPSIAENQPNGNMFPFVRFRIENPGVIEAHVHIWVFDQH